MKRKTVLIVDDDRALSRNIADGCQKMGLNVHTAHSVIKAMAILDQGLPDLICVDVNMPSSNGLSVTEMIETDEQAAKIPVIALTDKKDAETIRRAGSLCCYYVQKKQDAWRRVEPVIYELIDIDPVSQPTGKE